jgi:hypothetical protein
VGRPAARATHHQVGDHHEKELVAHVRQAAHLHALPRSGWVLRTPGHVPGRAWRDGEKRAGIESRTAESGGENGTPQHFDISRTNRAQQTVTKLREDGAQTMHLAHAGPALHAGVRKQPERPRAANIKQSRRYRGQPSTHRRTMYRMIMLASFMVSSLPKSHALHNHATRKHETGMHTMRQCIGPKTLQSRPHRRQHI